MTRCTTGTRKRHCPTRVGPWGPKTKPEIRGGVRLVRNRVTGLSLVLTSTFVSWWCTRRRRSGYKGTFSVVRRRSSVTSPTTVSGRPEVTRFFVSGKLIN